MVFITSPSEEEAKKIAGKLIEERVAACVNIIPAIKSLFFWQGKEEMSDEYLLIAKTRKSCFKRLEDIVKKLHSYDTPEIVSVSISEASRDYLNWIDEVIP